MLRRLRIPLLILGVFLALGVLACASLDTAAPIDYYRVVGEDTIVVGAGTGPTLWPRITSVSETASEVVVDVRSVRAPVPSTGMQVTELTVTLRQPLGDRRIVDGSTGLPIVLR